MSERKDECTSETCIIHTRTDGVKRYADGEGMAAKVTYLGDYAVMTKVNEALDHPSAYLLRMMGAKADVFYTSVVFVGEGTIGDFIESDGDAYGPIRFLETHTLRGEFNLEDFPEAEAEAEKFHDGIMEAIKADTLDLTKPFTKRQWVTGLFNSIKPIEGFEDGGDLQGLLP